MYTHFTFSEKLTEKRDKRACRKNTEIITLFDIVPGCSLLTLKSNLKCCCVDSPTQEREFVASNSTIHMNSFDNLLFILLNKQQENMEYILLCHDLKPIGYVGSV